MTNEENKIAAEAIDTAPEEAESTTEAAANDDKSNASLTDNDIDYAAELEKERERARLAQEKLDETRRKAKERWEQRQREKTGGDEAAGDESVDTNRPLTVAELETILARERQLVRREALQTQILETAKRLAGSDVEAQLIVEKHKTLVFPEDMPIAEQIESVYAIVNRKKLIGERNEALRAAKSAKNVSDNPAVTYQDSKTTTPKASSAGAKAELARMGFTFNSVTQRFEKKTASGKVLIHDPKTGAIRPA